MNRQMKAYQSKNYTKFIMIGSARSGTTYVQSLLSSHSKILSFGEVFHLLSIHFSNNDGLLRRLMANPQEYINNEIYKDYPAGINAVGFKMVYSEIGMDNVFLYKMETMDVAERTKKRRDEFSRFMHMTFDLVKARQDFDDFLNTLINNFSIKVIHIKRRNKLNMLLSKKLAGISGSWNSASGPYLPNPVSMDIMKCIKFFENTIALEKKYDALFHAHDIFEIIYEDLIDDNSQIIADLQEFLGVEFRTLDSPLKKQNLRSPRETISNYVEIKEQLKETEWNSFFEF